MITEREVHSIAPQTLAEITDGHPGRWYYETMTDELVYDDNIRKPLPEGSISGWADNVTTNNSTILVAVGPINADENVDMGTIDANFRVEYSVNPVSNPTAAIKNNSNSPTDFMVVLEIFTEVDISFEEVS